MIATGNGWKAGNGPDRPSEGVRTLSMGIQCAGCGVTFTPHRTNQRHCRPACRKLAERKAEASRRRDLLDRLDPGDPGRPE